MSQPHDIKLAYYGDDFTGSTDALEFLSRAGAKTVLFMDNPSPKQLAQFEGLDAIGVAGMTRAMNPIDMYGTLDEAFQTLKELEPKHVHYKVCSTFDSSPEIGNIGTAIQVGQDIFQNDLTPILIAAPHLGRYSAFGNLFARMGIGSEGKIYRLDQHPSMSKHPTTPAKDGDLRDHLAHQTDMKMGLIDLIDLEKGSLHILKKITALQKEGTQIIFFDGMYESQMAQLGEVLDSLTSETCFSVGSSGVEKALGDYWGQQEQLQPRSEWELVTEEESILVLSGSASPVTAAQIDHAEKKGWQSIRIEAEALAHPDTYNCTYADLITEAFNQKKSVILHTCKGPDDHRLIQMKAFFDKQKNKGEMSTAKTLGGMLGEIAAKALTTHPINRLVIAGGDTSSYAARALGIEAVEMIAPIVPGAPLCRVIAHGSPADGMEINLKGGQVGDEFYFENLRKGRLGR